MIHVSGIKAEQVVILHYVLFIIKKTRNVLTKAMYTIHSCVIVTLRVFFMMYPFKDVVSMFYILSYVYYLVNWSW